MACFNFEKTNDLVTLSNLYPGNASVKGFLANGEDFNQVRQRDLDNIKYTGITCTQIADRIESILRGQCTEQFIVNSTSYWGYQNCPLCNPDEKDECDDDCRSDNESIIINKKTKEQLFIPGLIIHLIKKHQFFEGNTPYRVDPLKAIRILDINPNIDYKPQSTPLNLNYEIESHIKIKPYNWLYMQDIMSCFRYSK